MRAVELGSRETDGLTQIGLLLIVVGLAPTGEAAYEPGLITWAVMAPGAAVATLTTDTTEHDIYASIAITGAFDGEVRESIATGLPVTFSYYLEVARRRLLWFDKILVHKTVTTTVAYDTLTRQYSLTRRVNDEVTETSVAVDEAEMMRWMTRLNRVRLADPAALEGVEDGSLYVRVKSRFQRRFILYFIPWEVETGWEKVRLNLSREGTGRGR